MIREYAERTNVAGLWRVFLSQNSNLCSTNPWVFVCSFVSERKNEDIRFSLTLFLISNYRVFIQERFYKLIYNINTAIKYGI